MGAGGPLSDELVEPLLDLLQTLRNVCDGDLEKNIILLTIAVRTVAHPEFAKSTNAERLAGEDEIFPTLGVNARSIAEASGIPRETARRKIAELIRAGWIAQEGRNLHYTSKAYRELDPARKAIEQMAIRFAGIVTRREAEE